MPCASEIQMVSLHATKCFIDLYVGAESIFQNLILLQQKGDIAILCVMCTKLLK